MLVELGSTLNLQDSRASQVATVAEVRGGHHVLGVEHLLGQLWDGDGTEGMGTAAGQRSESNHEEMETGEGNHVDSQLSEIRVELTWESETSGDTGHNGRDQVVEISVRWVGELESSHANFVECLVVDTEGRVGVLNQLMDGEGGVVRLNNSVGNLGRWDDREGGHHTIGELLTDLGDQQRTHTGTGSTTERVGDLETLKAVAALGLAANDIKDLVDELGTFSVMTLSPVVSSAGLTEDEVVGAEQLTEGTGADSLRQVRTVVEIGVEILTSMVPGSKSTRTARGTYLLPEASLK